LIQSVPETIPVITTNVVKKSTQYKNEKEKILNLLEKERELEKKNAFKKCNLLARINKLNMQFLCRLNEIPLISNELFQENNGKDGDYNEFYDESEYELSKEHLFIDREGLSDLVLPSVTQIISIADEKSYQDLLNWKLKEIETLGYDGFMQQNELNKKKGKIIHKVIECLLTRQELPLIKENLHLKECISAVKSLIEKDFDTKCLLSEANVSHNNLYYQGRIDCLAFYKNKLCLIDWKRSNESKLDKKSLFSYPIQLAAYTGAFLNDTRYKEMRKKNDIEMTLIVNIADNGTINVHEFNYQEMEFYWYQYMSFLKNFWFIVLKDIKDQNNLKKKMYK